MDTAHLYGLLEEQHTLIDRHLSELLDFNVLERRGGLGAPVILKNCHIDNLSALGIDFLHPVELAHCRVRKASFFGSHFLGGLSIRCCTFDSRVDFELGGFNDPDCTILIEDCVFEGFANFFDCWFRGPVIVRNTRFERGTNLMGVQGMPGEVKFEVRPVMENVAGRLNAAHEWL